MTVLQSIPFSFFFFFLVWSLWKLSTFNAGFAASTAIELHLLTWLSRHKQIPSLSCPYSADTFFLLSSSHTVFFSSFPSSSIPKCQKNCCLLIIPLKSLCSHFHCSPTSAHSLCSHDTFNQWANSPAVLFSMMQNKLISNSSNRSN